MKYINNYISEKLHISKDLKINNIKVGMKIRSDDALYELIDFISADASDNEISEFFKKYKKDVDNYGAWIYNITNNKLTPTGRKSLDEFGYIMILKYIKRPNEYVMVYYNQQFFKPITEKLHLNKNFKTKSDVKYENWATFSEYLDKIGISITNNGSFGAFVCTKETGHCPFMNIYHGNHGFFINFESDTRNGEVKVCVDDGKMTYVTFDADDYEFDIDPEYKGVRYLYTANNGDILLEILEAAKEKFC